MMKFAFASASLAMLALPAAAMAQPAWVPASEITGQSVQVVTNGVTNTLYFDPGGSLRIASPQGNVVNGSWAVNGGQLCLNAGSGAECFPYAQAFQAAQPVTLTSSCNATSVWTANAVNPPPKVENMGERG